MENNDSPENKEAELAKQPKVSSMVKKARSRVKPLVEGINAPKSTADILAPKVKFKEKEAPKLSPAENNLIMEPLVPELEPEEPRLLSKQAVVQAQKQRHRVKGPVIAGLIILAMVAAGYGAYIWKLKRDVPSFQPAYHPVLTPSAPGSSAGAVSSSTPAGLPSATSTPAQATATPAVASLRLKITSTPTGYLNVRDLPSPQGKIIAKVLPGEVYTYVTAKNGWYEIMLNNQLGWVSGQYVTKQQ